MKNKDKIKALILELMQMDEDLLEQGWLPEHSARMILSKSIMLLIGIYFENLADAEKKEG